MRNRATSHDSHPSGVLARRPDRVLVKFKNLAAIPGIVGYRTSIVRRRTTFSPVLTFKY